ncbi:hypothetical protein SAMN05444266_110176 [Chitinophaga jiangningensis]|uniref:Uncharacterized protein n=1 Tax=Chitinophaga jiangningensis TaxID=1419482 RepID=A0A1M7L8L0_9BACT|nr:hypothetical protein SAMN05444266_110176 [Chitinophaga jiangningensis]
MLRLFTKIGIELFHVIEESALFDRYSLCVPDKHQDPQL